MNLLALDYILTDVSKCTLLARLLRLKWLTKWARARQNQQNDVRLSEESDRPRYPPYLFRSFASRSDGSQGPKASSRWQRILWSEWADAILKLISGFVLLRLKLYWYQSWNGPRQANLVLIAYASSEGSGEPAHPRSLARTSAARSYKQWVMRNLQTEGQIPGPSEWLGKRS